MSDESVVAAYDAAGGSVATQVANLLVDAEFTNVFTQSLSAAVCPEPIVVLVGSYDRDSEQVGAERGERVLDVIVCREVNAVAEAVSLACEQALRTAEWDTRAGAYLNRITGIDTDAPEFRGRDGSGRYLWDFKVYVTIARPS
ncbi:hypothetical protein [Atopobium sp. oral taxon 810]|uniref:hypothetical protein n=1 Tax=Atopobium sp. oral taxon 810 TaxID=712158 RepID=UPI000396815F|nr:hypothetical protein [Atopobium sp. oral taxon 810]ERI04012.1 hypothetical protein HMPREF9069_01777 [Atopobium sp. oral taxon 810 str. F0209]DAW07928.1 MAG TPA: hypothetical protein [Caudoviricetes sp.]